MFNRLPLRVILPAMINPVSKYFGAIEIICLPRLDLLISEFCFRIKVKAPESWFDTSAFDALRRQKEEARRQQGQQEEK